MHVWWITKHVLSYEDWATVLSELTYVINSYPLFPEVNPWDFHCITANGIIHPYGEPNLPQFVEEEVKHSRKMFQSVQNKVDIFWKIWLKHIPPQLNSRNKWFLPATKKSCGWIFCTRPGDWNQRPFSSKSLVEEGHCYRNPPRWWWFNSKCHH